MSPLSRALVRKVNQYAADLQSTVGSVARDPAQVRCQCAADRFKINVEPVRLNAPELRDDLYLFFGQLIAPRDGGHVHGFTVTRYWYQVVDECLDPYIRYEWDPEQDPSWPHMHVDRVASGSHGHTTLFDMPIGKLHLTTGRVLLEDVLQFLVRDGIVQPMDDRRYAMALDKSLTWARLASWGTLRD